MLSRPDIVEEPAIAVLHRALDRIPETAVEERERWYLYGEPVQQGSEKSNRSVLSTAMGQLRKVARTLTESAIHPLCIQQLSPAAAMFGSATPSIGQADAELFVQTLLTAFTQEAESTAHDSLVRDQPLAGMRTAYEEGYDLALDLLDTLGLPGEQEQSIDVSQLLQELGISASSVEMEDDGLGGVALAGPDLQPSILVNTAHPVNQRESGQRFTLAHELCHVLARPGLRPAGIPRQRPLGTARSRAKG